MTKDMLIVGDNVTITGWLAREAQHSLSSREIHMPDGRKFFVGPAAS